MPYKHIYMEPEIAYVGKDIENNEVLIFKTYDDNDVDAPFEYWFTLDDQTCGKENHYEFDIRNFKEYYPHSSIKENFDILVAKGYITSEGWKYNLEDELEKHLAGF